MKNWVFIAILLVGVNGLWIFFSFFHHESSVVASPEMKEIVLKSKKGAKIRLGFDHNDQPLIQLISKEGKPEIFLLGGQSPCLALFDAKGNEKMSLKGADPCGIFLKNEAEHVVATLSTLEDGGAGLGLADHRGSAASILRGGLSPGLSFYSSSPDPLASFGLLEKVAHFAVLGHNGEEGILIHGGVPTSMMLTDEAGALKVVISKHGIFKEKEQEAVPLERKKYFTYQNDLDRLFPDVQKSSPR